MHRICRRLTPPPLHRPVGWVAGCAFVYGALFGVGAWIMGDLVWAGVWGAIFVASGLVLRRTVPRLWNAAGGR